MTKPVEWRCPYCFRLVETGEYCSKECKQRMREYETSDGAKYSEVSHVG